jgi:phosphoserine phosphatase
MVRVVSLLVCLEFACCVSAFAAETLPSWNDVASKKAIVAFVENVTRENSLEFVPVSERIAVFDNDGTLWSEQPMYVQLAFAMDRVKALADKHPEWKTEQPFQAILEGDKALLHGDRRKGKKSFIPLEVARQVISATHAGMTADEFDKIVKEWLATAKHPKYNRPYTECVYQPMLELLAYLRENRFKTYIVSGGGVDFMRPWAQDVYGIPPEQVIGSSIKLMYSEGNGADPVLVRLDDIDFIDDKEGKPIGIHKFIGRRPIAAFGNSDGDYEMLRYVTSGNGARFGLIVHHTDADREAAYDRTSHFGLLDKGLNDAAKYGWVVVDMKNDWRQVFPGAPAGR